MNLLSNVSRRMGRIAAALSVAGTALLAAGVALAGEAQHAAAEGAAHAQAAAGAAHAEAAHGNPWLDLLYKAINVAILFAIIYWAARKPVAQGLTNLAKTTRDSFLSSRKSGQDLEAQMAEQKRKITALSQDLANMVAEAKADVEREKQRAQADAQAQAAKMQAQTQQQIEQEVAKARMALRKELADQTVKLAEELVKQKVNPAEQKRLVADYLKQLEAR